MNAIASLKGNLGLRSSPLSPTASKLSTQYLVLDHMANHYKKISKAKSSIDSQPPKSMASSQKARDNQRRKKIGQTGRSQSTSNIYRNTGTPTRNHYLSDEDGFSDEDDEDRLVKSIVRTTLNDRSRQDFNSQENNMGKTSRFAQDIFGNFGNTTDRPSSSRSLANHVSRYVQAADRCKKGLDNGDILQKRQHAFTEPDRPFTPRTLKSNRSSRLTEYKYYTPPKKTKGKVGGNTVTKELERDNVSENTIKHQHQPIIKPRKSSMKPANTMRKQRSDSPEYYEDNNVPPLNISVDQDNEIWRKKKDEGKFESDNIQQSLNQEDFSHPITAKDEEQLYVQFIQNITKEIINRGVYTDRALKVIFREHMERRSDLEPARMELELKRLQRELGVQAEHNNKTNTGTLNSTSTSMFKSTMGDFNASSKSYYGNPVQDISDSPSHRLKHNHNALLSSVNSRDEDIDQRYTMGYNNSNNQTLDSMNTLQFNSTQGELRSTVQSTYIDELEHALEEKDQEDTADETTADVTADITAADETVASAIASDEIAPDEIAEEKTSHHSPIPANRHKEHKPSSAERRNNKEEDSSDKNEDDYEEDYEDYVNDQSGSSDDDF